MHVKTSAVDAASVIGRQQQQDDDILVILVNESVAE
jgi:hypothetical protein